MLILIDDVVDFDKCDVGDDVVDDEDDDVDDNNDNR
jgi:hypothetical protein